jgi:hypothetical protein
MMHQSWIQVAGLALDLVGFLLVVREWKVAMMLNIAERMRGELQSGDAVLCYPDLASRFDMPAQQGGGVSPFRTSYEADKRRLRLFQLGIVAVLLGFVLQIVGTWPGGVGLPWIIAQAT